MTIIQTPVALFANIPGILGFYPTESIILMTFGTVAETGSYALGPVWRLDVSDRPALSDLCGTLNAENIDRVEILIVSTNDQDRASALHTLRAQDCPIANCWLTTEISTGAPYELAFSRIQGVPAQITGQIAQISQSITMRKMVSAGHRPEPTRAEAFAAFDRQDTWLPEGASEALEARAQERAAALWHDETAEAADKGAVAALLAEFDQMIRTAEETTTTADSYMVDQECLTLAATVLAHSMSRDAIMVEAIHRPAPVMSIMLATARTCTGIIRANALSVYAVAAATTDLAIQPQAALTAAQDEIPGHTLSSLIMEGYNAGAFRMTAEAIKRGSELTRAKFTN
ncbi:DUF4192 domain-containing protein [Corynebacterium sp. A21]|uniref:DUF4192 domain-containing protein n=1 Tax=Corynebacterium sp. A21 TaxID=3457318 RepID=UPI003FD3E6D0